MTFPLFSHLALQKGILKVDLGRDISPEALVRGERRQHGDMIATGRLAEGTMADVFLCQLDGPYQGLLNKQIIVCWSMSFLRREILLSSSLMLIFSSSWNETSN